MRSRASGNSSMTSWTHSKNCGRPWSTRAPVMTDRTEAAIAVIGAGAMGAALGIHIARSNPGTVLLATEWDTAVVEAWRAGGVHPVLGLAHPALPCRSYEDWDSDLATADTVVVAVSTEGLRPVLAHAI